MEVDLQMPEAALLPRASPPPPSVPQPPTRFYSSPFGALYSSRLSPIREEPCILTRWDKTGSCSVAEPASRDSLANFAPNAPPPPPPSSTLSMPSRSAAAPAYVPPPPSSLTLSMPLRSAAAPVLLINPRSRLQIHSRLRSLQEQIRARENSA